MVRVELKDGRIVEHRTLKAMKADLDAKLSEVMLSDISGHALVKRVFEDE
jgi:hypothetical protein